MYLLSYFMTLFTFVNNKFGLRCMVVVAYHIFLQRCFMDMEIKETVINVQFV